MDLIKKQNDNENSSVLLNVPPTFEIWNLDHTAQCFLLSRVSTLTNIEVHVTLSAFPRVLHCHQFRNRSSRIIMISAHTGTASNPLSKQSRGRGKHRKISHAKLHTQIRRPPSRISPEQKEVANKAKPRPSLPVCLLAVTSARSRKFRSLHNVTPLAGPLSREQSSPRTGSIRKYVRDGTAAQSYVGLFKKGAEAQYILLL